MADQDRDRMAQLSLPPGFRFHPTDEELLVKYLGRKVAGHRFSFEIIGEIDLYKFDPWVLPSKAIFGEKEWYFFTSRNRKYPNGSRPNRIAGSGFWKATGTDKLIESEGRRVGIKKALVFYVGKAPKGAKTNWIMHEYRLSQPCRKDGSSKLDDWVLCRIYQKSSSSTKSVSRIPIKEHSTAGDSEPSTPLKLDGVLESRVFALPHLNSVKSGQEHDKLGLRSFSGSGDFDWSTLSGFNPVLEFGQIGVTQQRVQTQGMSQVLLNDYGRDIYVPSLPALCHVESPTEKFVISSEEIVESGLGPQRVSSGYVNSCFFNPNAILSTQNYSNSVDPFGVLYPNPCGGFGFIR
ncbi:hypothetical protein Nepgr_027374 [Nepenthes gracilis]|uniref:NAC domain-containing protein n=1 Tax=Nepenthes gracilis TaxID=150966 RepID=A0AAD3Y3H1_NEPGR|nr:hypothetical protein Nepgr_027374 [Nepenthes gracilis]